jgi:hypothetical protein
VYGAVPVAQADRAAVHRGPFEIAGFLRSHLALNDRAVIIAASHDGEVPMAYQRVFGQLNVGKETLLCSFLPDTPDKTLHLPRDVRFVVFWHDRQEPEGGDNVGQLDTFATSKNHRIVFANSAAVVYERIGDD